MFCTHKGTWSGACVFLETMRLLVEYWSGIWRFRVAFRDGSLGGCIRKKLYEVMQMFGRKKKFLFLFIERVVYEGRHGILCKRFLIIIIFLLTDQKIISIILLYCIKIQLNNNNEYFLRIWCQTNNTFSL